MASPKKGVKETPTVAVAGGTNVVAGQVYLINGKPTVAPTNQTAAAWATQIGGSPVVAVCDVPSRTHGAFLPANHPANMDLLGNQGLDVFEV